MMKIAFHPFGDERLFIFAVHVISGYIPALSKADSNVNMGGTAEFSRFRPKERRLIYFLEVHYI